MKKIITILILVLLAIPLVLAMLIPAADKAKENAKADNSLVIEKVEIEGVEHLTLTPPGLEKIVFIHYKKGFAKPPWAGGGKPDKGTKCYDFLGRGVKWKELPVSYVIHPDLEAGAISASAETWDDATLEELFSDSYELDSTVSWDGWKNSVPDGRNELLFGDYPQEGVIAVAVVWGYFSGPPSTRQIIEFDFLFDTDFTWGDATVDPTVMDLQNIATHEIGHGAGLADLYDTACSEETMYGYSGYGETKKRDLNIGDITGITTLYGA